ncbi:MAG: ABC transporter ATP-binding protein [Candidatus Wallacebacter cryptica]|jgi:peptide/nickel transport system ATP-binding protein|nr:ABC transporter ATP-binding protein [Bacillota bacterium]NLJ03835.1 ABC transporter ATP-binding protein [Bacillota bacterium]
MGETIVKIDDLNIRIKLDEGILTPVRGVSLSIRENETLGLVGESGCGKSLTSKAILGINDKKCVTTGRIDFNVDGEWINLLELNPRGAKIRGIRGKMASMVFQEPMSSFSPLFKIGSQIAEPIRLHITKDKKKAKELAINAMREVGISNPEERYSQYPHEFSGGMLQRALIAMALVCNPKLLIADEPTTALDVTIQAQILDLMKRLQKEHKMAILYVTHDLGTVAKMCDRVAVMYLGRIVETGTVLDIFKNPLHPYTKGLLGSVHKIGSGKERLFSIEGTVPLAMNLEKRCSFYDRCTYRDAEKCTKEEPPLREVEAGHWVACTLDFPAVVNQNIM